MGQEDQLKKILKEIGETGISGKIEELLNQLAEVAKALLKIIQEKDNALSNAISFTEGNQLKVSCKDLYNIIVQTDRTYTKKITAAVELFQAKRNEVNNVIMGLIYFDIDSNNIIAMSQQTMAAYFAKHAQKVVSQKGRGRSNIRSLAGKTVEELETQEVWKQLARILNEISQKFREDVLDEALRRRKNPNMYYKREYKGTKTTEHRNSFYWWPNEDSTLINWSASFKNRGFIAQGYVEALVRYPEESFKEPASDNIEENLKILAGYAKLDNKSAIKGQDIVLNFNEARIQFSIKSGSFSTARYGQYVKEAIQIVAFQTLVPEEERAKFLTKDINYDDIVNYIKEISKNNYKTILDAILKSDTSMVIALFDEM